MRSFPRRMLPVAAVLMAFWGSIAPGAPEDDFGAPVKPAVGAEKPHDKAGAETDAAPGKSDEPAPADDAPDEIERLERAIEGMREAHRRMAAADTGKGTQEIQEQVVQDLERLLKFLKKQQRNRRNNPSQNQNQNENQSSQDQQQRQQAQKDQLDPQNSGKRSQPDKSTSPGQGRREPKARDSEERHDPARAGADEEMRRSLLIKDVWGHLPPHVREAMQQSFKEKYLPKYEELVKRYYESLAEKNRKRSGK